MLSCNTASSHVTTHSPSRSVVKHLVRFADLFECQWKRSTKSIICPIQYLDLMATTLRLVTSSALQHLSSIDRVCRHRRGGSKLFLFLPAFNMLRMWELWCNEKNARCGVFYIASGSCSWQTDRLLREVQRMLHTLVGCNSKTWNLLVLLLRSMSEIYGATTPQKNCIILQGPTPTVCIYCACESRLLSKDGCFPQCEDCTTLARRASRRASRIEINNVHLCICVS